jgi:translocator protein
MKNWNLWIVPALSIVFCLAIGGLSSILTSESVRDWYPTIHKPSWTPPSWLFGPVWTILYAMIAIAVWLVWCRRESGDIHSALVWFAFQLFLNAPWSPLFFGLKNPLAGLLDIISLWAAIPVMLKLFWKVLPSAVRIVGIS